MMRQLRQFLAVTINLYVAFFLAGLTIALLTLFVGSSPFAEAVLASYRHVARFVFAPIAEFLRIQLPNIITVEKFHQISFATVVSVSLFYAVRKMSFKIPLDRTIFSFWKDENLKAEIHAAKDNILGDIVSEYDENKQKITSFWFELFYALYSLFTLQINFLSEWIADYFSDTPKRAALRAARAYFAGEDIREKRRAVRARKWLAFKFIVPRRILMAANMPTRILAHSLVIAILAAEIVMQSSYNNFFVFFNKILLQFQSLWLQFQSLCASILIFFDSNEGSDAKLLAARWMRDKIIAVFDATSDAGGCAIFSFEYVFKQITHDDNTLSYSYAHCEKIGSQLYGISIPFWRNIDIFIIVLGFVAATQFFFKRMSERRISGASITQSLNLFAFFVGVSFTIFARFIWSST